MKTTLAAGLLAVLTISSVQAGSTILVANNSRDKAEWHELNLNEDGNSCTRIISKADVSTVKSREELELNSKACTYLKIAKKLDERLGGCDEKIITVEREDYRNYRQKILTGKNGLELGTTILVEGKTQQSCLCGEVVSTYGNVGLGMLRPLPLIFDGPYYKHDLSLKALSAENCAELFEAEEDKKIVLETYKEFETK